VAQASKLGLSNWLTKGAFRQLFHQLNATSNTVPSAIRGVILALLLLFPMAGASLLVPSELPFLGVQSISVGEDGESDADGDSGGESGENETNATEWNWTATVPTWNVGDVWTYSTVLDAVALVEDTPELEGAELDFLYGTALMEVTTLGEVEVDGVTTPVYTVVTSGTFIGDGRNFPAPILGTVDGNLIAGYSMTEQIRVADLALVSYEKRLVFEFEAIVAFISQTVDISDSTETSTYNPPLEFYDFPLAVNESWNTVTNHTSDYTGGGDLVDVPDEPESYIEERVLSINRTVDDVFPGCANSTEIWMHDSKGELEESRVWCPAVNQYSQRWTNDIALGGVNATLNLIAYAPASASRIISLTIEPNRSALNAEVEVNITVTDGQGNPISGASGYLYHRATTLVFTTTENGTTTLTLDVGNAMDSTPTAEDWATDGVVAILLADQVVGVTTVTLEGSSIGGILRLEAAAIAVTATEFMANFANSFEIAIRY
jgi:hypothetical protein